MGSDGIPASHTSSRGDISDNIDDFNDIRNQTSARESRSNSSLARHGTHDVEASSNGRVSIQRKTLLKSLFWPLVIIIIPITLLSTALLGLIYGYRVNSDDSLFPTSTAVDEHSGRRSYVLVNYSATRLVFVASFLSSLAPILASSIMTLWSLPIAERMRIASIKSQHSALPTPYQLSLVVGIILASYERLWQYFLYAFSKSPSKIAPVLNQTAIMLSIAIILAAAVCVSDSALHYYTETIPFDRISVNLQPTRSFGRGLSERCLNFNRTKNYQLPCSYDPMGENPDALAELYEGTLLQHNQSISSAVRIVKDSRLSQGDLAILNPSMLSLPPDIDYRAETIGVSSQCRPITTQCDMRQGGPSNMYTLFNCSEWFWGVLGKAPNLSEITGIKPDDPNVPLLGYKPAPNLQFAFFSDPTMKHSYNPEGYDETNQPNLPMYPDSELINPIWFGLAARASLGAQSPGSNIENDTEIFIGEGVGYMDFAFQCSLASYNVNYTWINGTVQDISFTTSLNGTLLEMFHGVQFYSSVGGGYHDLQDYLSQAMLQNTIADVARQWGDLYSIKILSTIGGYSRPRRNLLEQQRTQVLVAKVSKAALGALIGSSLAYSVLGTILGFVAYKASATDVRDLAAQLSLTGLTAAAFGERGTLQSADGQNSRKGEVFNEKLTREETRRIFVQGDSQSGFDLRVMI